MCARYTSHVLKDYMYNDQSYEEIVFLSHWVGVLLGHGVQTLKMLGDAGDRFQETY